MPPADLLDIFESHGIARKKLKNELQLFIQGELNLGNVHIYENNQERTRQLLDGDENVKFDLNV